MKAVILAGGEGTRLRPLTCSLPKPLVQICTKPVLGYILGLLASHGCTEAAVAARYRSEQIERYISGISFPEMKIFISKEEKPLGTAGCTKLASKGMEEDILVISGDAVCDFDLSAIYEHHIHSGADATIVVKKVEDPREYGLITGDNGTVTGFCEKPSYVNCRSELANTGIYVISRKVLELVTDGIMYDFAKDVFPAMLNRGMKLGYYEEKGYWCDIGDIPAYKRCCLDMISGRVKLPVPENAADNADKGQMFISQKACVSPDASISGNCIIGDGAYISAGAKINGAVIMNGVFVGEDATLNDCIVCCNAKIGSGSAVYENAVIGEDSEIGENTVVSSGVRIWQNKHIGSGNFVTSDVKYGFLPSSCVSGSGIKGATNTAVTPGYAARAGCAVSSIIMRRAAVACEDSQAAVAMKRAFLSGISSAGKNAFDCKEIPLAVLGYCAGLLDCDIIVYISAGEQTDITICAEGMLPLTRSQERILENAFTRGEYMNAGWDQFGKITEFTGASELYGSMLCKLSHFTLPYDINLICRNKEYHKLCLPAAKAISGGREKLTLTLDQNTQKAEISSASGKIDHISMLLLACAYNAELGYDTALPNDFPHTAELIAQAHGRDILRYYESPMDNKDKPARDLAKGQLFRCDGFVSALYVLAYMYEHSLSVKEALAQLPECSAEKRFIRISCPPHRLFSKVGARPEENEGAVLEYSDRRVFMRPDKQGTGIFLFAESFGSETAASLCDKAEKLLRDAMP